MRLLSFDTETYLIQPTDAAPKPVVCSWADADKEWLSDPGSLETAACLFDPQLLLIGQNISYDLVLMMRWYPRFIPTIIRALDEGRVFDTQMRERMLHLKDTGTLGYNPFPSLGDLTLKYLKKDVSDDKKGDDIWRLKYGTLDGIPFEQWPAKAISYPKEDARHTFDVFQAQGGIHNIQPTEQMQIQSAVVLNATGVWGFAINQSKREVIKKGLEKKAAEFHKEIDTFGWTGKGSQKRLMDLVARAWHYKQFQFIQLRADVTGIKVDVSLWQQHIAPTLDIKTIMWQSIDADAPLPGLLFPPQVDWKMWCKETIKSLPGAPIPKKGMSKEEAKALPGVPMTKKGVSTAGEVLEQLGDVIKEFATYTEMRHVEKMLENYIEPYFRDTVHPRFVPLVTTGRTGCREPNTQNVPRKDELKPDDLSEAFRTMFMARPGCVLGTVDYSQLELCTLAASIRTMFPGVACTLGDAIDAGRDVHCITGGLIAGMSYEVMLQGKKAKDPIVGQLRQSAKAVNFGKPGGLGVGAFIGYAKNNYGVKLDHGSAYKIISAWEKAWPEIPNVYLKYSSDQIKTSPTGTFTAYTITGRPKANCIYTEGSNYPFQGLAADGAKAALWAIWKEMILGWYWQRQSNDQYFLNGYVGRESLSQQYGWDYKDSPLANSHIVNFVHDEIVAEHPEGDVGKAALARQESLMVSEMTRICQNKIKIRVEGNLSDAWEH